MALMTWALSACGGGGDDITATAQAATSTSAAVEPQQPDWVTQHLGLPTGQYVVTSEAEWQALWQQRMDAEFDITPAPKVDFAKHRLLLVADFGSSGCDDLSISSLVATKTGWQVQYQKRSSAGPDTACTDDVPSLTDAVLVPQDNTMVEFIGR